MDPKTLPQMPDELLMLVGAMYHVRGEAKAKQAATKLQAWGAACYAAGMDRAAQYRQAIDDELVTIESTVDTYPDARAAVRALIDWHVMVALDPAVSSDARALVHRGMDRAAEVCDTLKMGRPGHSAAHDVVLYRGDCADAIREATACCDNPRGPGFDAAQAARKLQAALDEPSAIGAAIPAGKE